MRRSIGCTPVFDLYTKISFFLLCIFFINKTLNSFNELNSFNPEADWLSCLIKCFSVNNSFLYILTQTPIYLVGYFFKTILITNLFFFKLKLL